MKVKICISVIISLLPFLSNAQLLDRLKKKVENKVNQRIERKTDKAIDKALDKTEETVEGKKTKTGKTDDKKKSNQAQENNSTSSYSSKFDFLPGEKIIFFDDFERDATGDFPVRWNTNGTGEVVSMRNQNGKWLRIPDNTTTFPEIQGILPQNFTIEFDLIYPTIGKRPPVTFGFTEVAKPDKNSIQHKNIFYFLIPSSVKQFIGYSTSLYSGREITQEWPVDKLADKKNHVSISVNGNRVRLYVDDQKIIDLPKGFDKTSYRNNFHFRAAQLLPKPSDAFYITNVRIAETGKDIRSMLVNEGKYSTTGIYFASGSALIKPESQGILKEIATILNEDDKLQIEIIGHTDNVGNISTNQKLSEQRATAVKDYFNKNFGVSNDRITVTGKGQVQPIADNNTTEGKAQNRRVEFVRK
jgi:OOP family OmpA-OmpF porin